MENGDSRSPERSSEKAIKALRKTTLGGEPYTRPPAIEQQIRELGTLSPEALLSRCAVTSREDPDYVASECVLHFLRCERHNSTGPLFAKLYALIAERIVRTMPGADGGGENSLNLTKSLIRDEVVYRFLALLGHDCKDYSESLDYFEIRFDGALANLRRDAKKKVYREQNRVVPIETNEENDQMSPAVEEAAGSFDPFDPAKIEQDFYRSQLYAAIDTLPPIQMRVIQMLLKGFPIDSQDPDVVTISKTLQKSEKTIRNYRDSAFATLRAQLKEDGGR